MSMNDRPGYVGADVVDGLRNFTTSSNPANELKENGVEERYDAYAKMGDRGFQTGEPGVAEAEPGLLQSTKIAPLAPEGSGGTEDDFTAAGTGVGSNQTASSAYETVAGAAKSIVDAVTGGQSA